LKHSGAIALFDKDFWLYDAFDLRQRCDYAALYRLPMDEAERTLENAESFICSNGCQIFQDRGPQGRYIGKDPAGGFVGIVLIPGLISSPRNCEENI
jgi:hypothetical protein